MSALNPEQVLALRENVEQALTAAQAVAWGPHEAMTVSMTPAQYAAQQGYYSALTKLEAQALPMADLIAAQAAELARLRAQVEAVGELALEWEREADDIRAQNDRSFSDAASGVEGALDRCANQIAALALADAGQPERGEG